MSTYVMMDGSIRIYDSTDDKRSQAGGDVQVYDDSLTSWTDKTSEAFSDAASLTGTFMVAADDAVYVGHTSPFARITVDLDTVAVGAGALVPYYYNGSAWTALTVTDGTASGGNTMAADGVISFKPPSDWAVQGNVNLDSDKYYIRLESTSVPSTPPNAEKLWPVDGQYFNVIFDEGNLSAPEGRARPEETMIFHRGRGDSNSHYIAGPDTPIFEPLELSFSVRLDTVYNKEAFLEALMCGNPNLSTAWDATGVSTKTDLTVTSGDGVSVSTPAFVDASKKTVCIQIVWERDGVKIGRAYHEVLVTPDQVSLAESEDGVILSVTAQVYGPIEVIHHFAYQY